MRLACYLLWGDFGVRGGQRTEGLQVVGRPPLEKSLTSLSKQTQLVRVVVLHPVASVMPGGLAAVRVRASSYGV
jgi:hypothetical protein